MEYVFKKQSVMFTPTLKSVLLFMCFHLTYCQEITENTILLNNTEFQETTNCTIQPAFKRAYLTIGEKINDNNRLIELDIKIKWKQTSQNTSFQSSLNWFLTTTDSGERLLLLPENFTIKSFGTLSYGIANLHLLLNQEPEDCLANLTTVAVDILLKRELLTLVSKLDSNDSKETKKFRICNGTSETGGFCCELSPGGEHIQCRTLKDKLWSGTLKFVFVIIAFFVVAQSISWMPSYIYLEDQNHAIKFQNLDLDMHIQITNTGNIDFHRETWKQVSFRKDPMLSEFRKKLLDSELDVTSNDKITVHVKSISGVVNENMLHPESFPAFGFCQFFNICLRDIFKLCKVCLRNIFKLCKIRCCCFSINYIVVFLLLYIWCLPYALLNSSMTAQSDVTEIFLVTLLLIVNIFIVPLMLICMFKIINKGFRGTGEETEFDLKDIILHSLCITNERGSTFRGQSVPLRLRLLQKIISGLPLVQFLFLVVSNVVRYRNKSKKTFYFYFLFYILCLFSVMTGILSIILIITAFYIECLFCTILGLVLNYNDVFHFVVLLLIFIKFVIDSINEVNHTMNKFTKKIFRAIRQLSKESRGNETKQSYLLQGDVDHSKGRFAFCDKDESITFLHTGVAVIENFVSPENIYVRHVHKGFINKVASLPGHLTPGSKISLLLLSIKEIIIVTSLFAVILILLSTFGSENDVSGNVKTLFTLITGTVAIIFAKLWFENETFSDSDKDVYFKALLKNYLATNEEQLMGEDIEFDITCTKDNENDADLIIKNVKKSDETWYIKGLVPKETFNEKEYLKRMFIGSYGIPSDPYELAESSP